MKAIVHVRKEGPWFVAMDLVTTVSGQGATEKEAIAVLLEGLRERYGGLKILLKKQKGTKVVELKGVKL
jgi:predicted RNase H-like HicB family nuclease